MTVTIDAGTIVLSGDCSVEDAEALLAQLLDLPDAEVDWRACDSLHTAVLQVLIAAGVAPHGPPRGAFLSGMVEPLLKAR